MAEASGRDQPESLTGVHWGAGKFEGRLSQ